jgi:hypothetical protein
MVMSNKPKERPVIMQTESVRSILSDLKTQTRRVMDLQPGNGNTPVIGEPLYKGCVVARWNGESEFDYYDCHCPKGKPGDRLWVKETWRLDDYNQEPKIENVIYKADMPQQVLAEVGDLIKWKSSMFMPRWASRLLLEITSIRAERLQTISEADAKAEGLTFRKPNFECGYEGFWGHPDWPHVECLSSPVKAYEKGWDSINKKRGFGWQQNPFVWAITFRKIMRE